MYSCWHSHGSSAGLAPLDAPQRPLPLELTEKLICESELESSGTLFQWVSQNICWQEWSDTKTVDFIPSSGGGHALVVTDPSACSYQSFPVPAISPHPWLLIQTQHASSTSQSSSSLIRSLILIPFPPSGLCCRLNLAPGSPLLSPHPICLSPTFVLWFHPSPLAPSLPSSGLIPMFPSSAFFISWPLPSLSIFPPHTHSSLLIWIHIPDVALIQMSPLHVAWAHKTISVKRDLAWKI